MAKKVKREETYSITAKGVILLALGDNGDEGLMNEIWDALELYGRRHDLNAVLLADNGEFIKVEKHD